MTSESDPLKVKTHFTRKPARCPKCRHQPVASIQYGFPYMTEKMQLKIEQGRVVLGGCEVSPLLPHWECTNCGWQGWRVYPDCETLNLFE